MIIDHISNRAQYYGLGEGYRTALDYFATVGSEPFEKANILLGDSGVLVKARPMMSKPEAQCSFEAHRLYADVHFLAYGEEKIGYAPVHTLTLDSYDPASDAAALTGKGEAVTLRPGFFMITLPQDAHMPCIAPGKCKPIGKMIAKIKLESEEQ